MKITDGKTVVEIVMKDHPPGEWSSENYAFDFFECGGLGQDDNGAYIVHDVDYCICQAIDWMNRRGDFYYDETENERMVGIIVIEQ